MPRPPPSARSLGVRPLRTPAARLARRRVRARARHNLSGRADPPGRPSAHRRPSRARGVRRIIPSRGGGRRHVPRHALASQAAHPLHRQGRPLDADWQRSAPARHSHPPVGRPRARRQGDGHPQRAQPLPGGGRARAPPRHDPEARLRRDAALPHDPRGPQRDGAGHPRRGRDSRHRGGGPSPRIRGPAPLEADRRRAPRGACLRHAPLPLPHHHGNGPHDRLLAGAPLRHDGEGADGRHDVRRLRADVPLAGAGRGFRPQVVHGKRLQVLARSA